MRTIKTSKEVSAEPFKPVVDEEMAKPRVTFCNPQEDGLGSALQIELHPATTSHPGSIMMEFVEQNGKGYCDVDGYHNGGFNWSHSLKFRVGMVAVAELISVIRGYQNNLGNGNGIDFQRKRDTINLQIEWDTDEKRPLILKAKVDGDVPWIYRMTRAEAVAMQLAFENSMARMAWGDYK